MVCRLLHPISQPEPGPPFWCRHRYARRQVLLARTRTFLDMQVAERGGAAERVLHDTAADPGTGGNSVHWPVTGAGAADFGGDCGQGGQLGLRVVVCQDGGNSATGGAGAAAA